jgi:putative photosynthetic complex assembly protein
LRFFDEPDGTVRVEDGATGEVLSSFGQGDGGFVRASVRSLVYQRKIRGEGPAVAFELIEWNNGDLTLRDPVTGQSVETSSFGGVNRAVFAAMLPKPEAR